MVHSSLLSSSIGIWLYDAHTYQKNRPAHGDHTALVSGHVRFHPTALHLSGASLDHTVRFGYGTLKPDNYRTTLHKRHDRIFVTIALHSPQMEKRSQVGRSSNEDSVQLWDALHRSDIGKRPLERAHCALESYALAYFHRIIKILASGDLRGRSVRTLGCRHPRRTPLMQTLDN